MRSTFIEDAMTAHLMWKLHLERTLAEERGVCADLTSATARAVDHCALGKWIVAEAAHYADSPEFRELIQSHTEFHGHAADVLQRVEGGDMEEAQRLMAGVFQKASRRVIKALYCVRDMNEATKTAPPGRDGRS